MAKSGAYSVSYILPTDEHIHVKTFDGENSDVNLVKASNRAQRIYDVAMAEQHFGLEVLITDEFDNEIERLIVS